MNRCRELSAYKRTRSRDAGRSGDQDHPPHTTSARVQHTYSALICPRHGKAAALVMPWCDTNAMNQHLIEISLNVADDAHAILMMDQAGWHMSNNLVVPGNITILPLPPKSPELNPVENVWQFMRDNWLSNRVFKSYEDIVDHCCYAWRTLQERPMEDHVHRTPTMGARVLINDGWYSPACRASYTARPGEFCQRRNPWTTYWCMICPHPLSTPVATSVKRGLGSYLVVR